MNKPYTRPIFTLLGLITLGSCTDMPQQSLATKTREMQFLNVPCKADSLLLYYQDLRKQSPTELMNEYDRSRMNLAQSRNETNRLRMALLLVLPNTPYFDLATAVTLVNEPTQDPIPKTSSLGGLSYLLSSILGEQQRITEDLSMRLKGEHKRAEILQDKVEILQRRAEESQVKMEALLRRAEALQVKVDAIKDMEKNIIRRDQP